MLAPAAILIAVGLAGMAVDGTARYLTHRDLVDAADAAANDAASTAIVHDAFGNGQVELDPAVAQATVARSLAARNDPILTDAQITVQVVPTAVPGSGAVEVTITADVDGIFFPLLDETITVTGRAELATSPTG